MNKKKEVKHLEWKLKQLRRYNRRFKIISGILITIIIIITWNILIK